MFGRVNKKLNEANEVQSFNMLLMNEANDDLGQGESGLTPEEEEIFVDPDSIDEETMKKVFAQVDSLVDEDDLNDGELESFLEDEEFEDVEV